MKKIIYKVAEEFNVKKNYKIFRLFQQIVNPPIGKYKKCREIKIEFSDRNIPIRVFIPTNNKENQKLIIFIHGGGWVAGSLNSYTNICYNMAKVTNRIIVAIGYRLAPENPFPAGFNDCYEVTRLIYKKCKAFNINPKDIVLMGDSAGGNLCAAVSQKSLDTKEFKINKQILLYPSLQCDYTETTKYKSVIKNGDDYIITRNQLCDFVDHYITNKNDLINIYASPLLSNHLKGLPKTLIITSEHDPLCDEGIAYAKKLKRHFVNVKLYTLNGAVHGFLTNILEHKYTDISYEKINKFLND